MFRKVSAGVFAFLSESGGSNCFLVLGKKEKVLVDSSSEDNRKAVLEGLSGLGLRLEDISLLLHTHGHADHFGLDFLFPRARIAMHEADAREINAGNKGFACSRFFPGVSFPKISLFLKAGMEIDLHGLKLKVLHLPGHTRGSVCFFLEKGSLLFSGDLLFSHGFGRTDLLSGDAKKMAESLKKLQKTPFELLLPGHGPLIEGREANISNLKQMAQTAATNAFL